MACYTTTSSLYKAKEAFAMRGLDEIDCITEHFLFFTLSYNKNYCVSSSIIFLCFLFGAIATKLQKCIGQLHNVWLHVTSGVTFLWEVNYDILEF
jgi:hypothetical protein